MVMQALAELILKLHSELPGETARPIAANPERLITIFMNRLYARVKVMKIIAVTDVIWLKINQLQYKTTLPFGIAIIVTDRWPPEQVSDWHFQRYLNPCELVMVL